MRPRSLLTLLDTLRRSTDPGREGSDLANNILDQIEDAFFFVDRDWRFVYVGRHFVERYSRVPVEEMLGRTIWELYPEMVGTMIEEKYRQAMETGVPVRFETRSLVSTRWFRVRAQPMNGGLAVFSTDLSDRKQAEEELQAAKEEAERRSLQLQDLAQAALEINAATSIDEALQICTDRAREIVGAHQGVTSLTLDRTWEQAVTAVSLSDKYGAYRSYDVKPTGAGVYSLVCELNQPLRMTQSQLEAHPAWKAFGAEARRHPPMRGWLAAPLIARDGRNLGLVQLSDRYEGEFTESDEAILVQLAQTASVAVENAWLFQTARRAREEAETANRVKDQFLATLSHELRTPLNAILGWAQLLRNRRADEAALVRGLEAIERNARSQTQLIEDLLDVSRIATGRLRLELRPVEPAEVIEAALSAVLPSAEAKGIRIESSLAAVGPVLGDPARLQQILVNVLSNAVKFTPSGGLVEVTLAAEEGRAVVRVRDTGQGIAPEFLPHVFDSFRQGDASTTRRQGGLGLGLAIVRQLVALHGGTATADSPGADQGATFTLTFPLALHARNEDSAAGLDASPGRAAEPRPPLEGLRILAVDDDLDTLEMMSELLSLRGAEVRSAGSADEAISALGRFDPHVLVSDISMPGRDGYELIRDIRSRGLGPETLPAVAVTALASSEDRRRALDAGYQVHLGKPVDPAELTSVLLSLGRHDAPA